MDYPNFTAGFQDKKTLKSDFIHYLEEQCEDFDPILVSRFIDHFQLAFSINLQDTETDTGNYFFGDPLLPLDFDWPATKDGKPYLFLLQIDCSTIPLKCDLPSNGSLVFFFNYQYSENWQNGIETCKVFYFSENEALTVKSPPAELELQETFQKQTFSFHPYLDVSKSIEEFDESFIEFDELFDYYDDYLFEKNTNSALKYIYEPSQLLGFPNPVQSHPFFEVAMRDYDWNSLTDSEKTKIDKEAQEYCLLLQLGPIVPELEPLWGDNTFYLILKKDALFQRDFTEVVVIAQNT